MKSSKLLPLLALAAWISGAMESSAQVFWRVSVKVFTDSNGNRPTGTTDQDIRDNINYNNRLLTSFARGCQFSITEIVQLPSSLSVWFNRAARNGDNRDALLDAAEANPALYRYRSDAINLYINNTSSGICCGSANGLVFIGNDAVGDTSTTIIHEIGHYLGLPHTQGAGCNGCCGPSENLSCCDSPGDDGISDTIVDLACWNRDQVSRANYFLPYASLSAPLQDRVDDVWNNIMSYHEDRVRMTPGQMDRLADFSNNDRDNVTGNYFRFVDSANGNNSNNGLTAADAFQTINGAVTGSGADDVFLIRAGTYSLLSANPWRITANRVFCARNGRVRLSRVSR